jgi:2-hydroxy-3-oxopropionate reductase
MGAPIAARLLGAGFEVAVWNRTAQKADDLAQLGARRAATPAGACDAAEMVVLMLTDAAAVAEVLFDHGVADSLAQHSLVVDMSSIAPAAARDHASRLAARGLSALDAPVSGGTGGARDGSLTIFVGGAGADFERARALFDALGTAHHLGPAGSGQVAKCANQLIVAVTIAAVAEAFELGASAGLDVAALRQSLMGGFADSRILREHGQRMVERAFEPGGSVRNQVKDLAAVLAVAEQHALPLPVTELVTSLYRQAAQRFGDLDHSALLLELERVAAQQTAPTGVP